MDAIRRRVTVALSLRLNLCEANQAGPQSVRHAVRAPPLERGRRLLWGICLLLPIAGIVRCLPGLVSSFSPQSSAAARTAPEGNDSARRLLVHLSDLASRAKHHGGQTTVTTREIKEMALLVHDGCE